MKVKELDSVTDRLVEEQGRARELQWEVEKERSRLERRVEGEREELEVNLLDDPLQVFGDFWSLFCDVMFRKCTRTCL